MNQILTAILALFLVVKPVNNLPVAIPIAMTNPEKILASRQISLETRYAVKSVNDVMKKNILLNLAYLSGEVKSKKDINWDELLKSKEYTLVLRPNETFAFHDSVLDEYKSTLVATTNAHFNSKEGFLSDGYLVGDGVCHFASIIYWAAKDAGLDALRTKSHSVAKIQEVPDEYGVSIYVDPSSGYGARNNLYVTNNKEHDVKFRFEYKEGGALKVSVIEEGLSA
jgi:hypothetical protein